MKLYIGWVLFGECRWVRRGGFFSGFREMCLFFLFFLLSELKYVNFLVLKRIEEGVFVGKRDLLVFGILSVGEE